MKPFARIVLALFIALAPMAFLGGCENWQRSVESRKETVRDGLAALGFRDHARSNWQTGGESSLLLSERELALEGAQSG